MIIFSSISTLTFLVISFSFLALTILYMPISLKCIPLAQRFRLNSRLLSISISRHQYAYSISPFVCLRGTSNPTFPKPKSSSSHPKSVLSTTFLSHLMATLSFQSLRPKTLASFWTQFFPSDCACNHSINPVSCTPQIHLESDHFFLPTLDVISG